MAWAFWNGEDGLDALGAVLKIFSATRVPRERRARLRKANYARLELNDEEMRERREKEKNVQRRLYEDGCEWER